MKRLPFQASLADYLARRGVARIALFVNKQR
jgi:hypothetical protein